MLITQRCLVTGGAGFIGSHLVRRLLNEGFKVRIVDDLSTGRFENLDEIIENVEWLPGSLNDIKLLDHACREVDYVFHLAALPSVRRSLSEPIHSHQVNSTGTLNLLCSSVKNSIKKFIYASSSSIYGNPLSLPVGESHIPDPLSPYAVSKLSGEYYSFVFRSLYKMKVVILRYFNVFGPRQNPFSLYSAVIPRFLKCLISGKFPEVYGDGEQTRDFTYVDNVVDANFRALNNDDADGQVFNISGGEGISLNKLISELSSISGKEIRPFYLDPRLGEVRHSQADISKANKILGYYPIINWKEGLRKTYDFFLLPSLVTEKECG